MRVITFFLITDARSGVAGIELARMKTAGSHKPDGGISGFFKYSRRDCDTSAT